MVRRANGRCPLADADDQLTVDGLIERYWSHAKGYYKKADDSPSSELDLVRLALRPVSDLYGKTLAADFGPLKLKAVKQNLVNGDTARRHAARNGTVAKGCCRTVANRHTSRIRLMFKWGVAKELVPASVHQGLQTLAGLQRSRCGARETKPGHTGT